MAEKIVHYNPEEPKVCRCAGECRRGSFPGDPFLLSRNAWWRLRERAAGRSTSDLTPHVAEVAAIEPWKDTQKYCVNFKEPAQKIGPISLVSGGRVTAPQNIRYTSFARLQKAKSLDDVF
jgi:hypothetical protein